MNTRVRLLSVIRSSTRRTRVNLGQAALIDLFCHTAFHFTSINQGRTFFEDRQTDTLKGNESNPKWFSLERKWINQQIKNKKEEDSRCQQKLYRWNQVQEERSEYYCPILRKNRSSHDWSIYTKGKTFQSIRSFSTLTICSCNNLIVCLSCSFSLRRIVIS